VSGLWNSKPAVRVPEARSPDMGLRLGAIRLERAIQISSLLFPSFMIAACGEAGGKGPPPDTLDATPRATIVDSLPRAAKADTLREPGIAMRNRDNGTWGGGQPWQLVEEVRIGGVDGDGPQILSQVVGLDVDALGRIYLLDRHAQAVHLFDARGGHVRTIGRGGGGPGEFREANGLALDRHHRLWVVDRNRFSVFDTSGAFLTTHRRQVTLWGFQWGGGFLDNGDLYDVTGVRSATATEIALVRYDSIAGFVDTLTLPTPSNDRAVWEFRSGSRRMLVSVPFAPSPAWLVDRRGYLWTGLTNEYRLYQLSLTGHTIGVVEHDHEPVPVTAAERDSIVDAVRERAGGAFVDASKIPREKPAWVRFVVDDGGYLWVMLSTPHGATVSRFDVFDPQGAYRGSVAAPATISTVAPLVMRDNAMYSVVMDQLGVPFVVRLRIEGR
jgi:hypothetical protein